MKSGRTVFLMKAPMEYASAPLCAFLRTDAQLLARPVIAPRKTMPLNLPLRAHCS